MQKYIKFLMENRENIKNSLLSSGKEPVVEDMPMPNVRVKAWIEEENIVLSLSANYNMVEMTVNEDSLKIEYFDFNKNGDISILNSIILDYNPDDKTCSFRLNGKYFIFPQTKFENNGIYLLLDICNYIICRILQILGIVDLEYILYDHNLKLYSLSNIYIMTKSLPKEIGNAMALYLSSLHVKEILPIKLFYTLLGSKNMKGIYRTRLNNNTEVLYDNINKTLRVRDLGLTMNKYEFELNMSSRKIDMSIRKVGTLNYLSITIVFDSHVINNKNLQFGWFMEHDLFDMKEYQDEEKRIELISTLNNLLIASAKRVNELLIERQHQIRKQG